jgi:hypothetical protein
MIFSLSTIKSITFNQFLRTGAEVAVATGVVVAAENVAIDQIKGLLRIK